MRRFVTVVVTVALSVALPVTLPIAQWGLSTSITASEPPAEEDLREGFWRSPNEPAAEFSLYVGTQAWETSFGSHSLHTTFGLTGSWIVTEWFELQAVADYSRRKSSPATLTVANTTSMLGVGPKFSLWFDFLRLYAETAAGGILRTSAYDDGRRSGGTARVSPGVQAGGGVALAMLGRIGVGIGASVRFHDDRSNFLLLLDVSMFTGTK